MAFAYLFTRRILLVALIGGGLLLAIVAWLHYPLTQDAGRSNGYNCSRAHIYIPKRLDFKGCRTVTGTIRYYKLEADGDSHASLQLDPQYKSMLTVQNYKKQGGYLVIEDTCHGRPHALLAKAVCRHYRSSLAAPEVGHRYEITGNYVIDDWHGSWAEIHGLAELRKLD